jgi:hypothetical protein
MADRLQQGTQASIHKNKHNTCLYSSYFTIQMETFLVKTNYKQYNAGYGYQRAQKNNKGLWGKIMSPIFHQSFHIYT